MSAVCPKYSEHGFCIHGTSCTLQHIDKPPTAMNGTLLKTSFGNLTLDDISSTPAFVPSAPTFVPHHIQQQQQQPNLQQQQQHYYLPSTRIDIPTRAYIPAPTHLEKPTTGLSQGNELCEELLYQQSVTSLFLESKLPDVDKYYALQPLEAESAIMEQPSGMHTFNFPSVCYRAYSSKDGCVYALRRFKNCQINTSEHKKLTERWRTIAHPNITTFHDCFITKQFGDVSFVVVYEFCPGARTLKQVHFQKDRPQYANTLMNTQSQTIEESLLWNYIIQLTAAIRAIHASKLSCRMINPSKILVTGRNRLRLNCVGVMDLLMGTPMEDPAKPSFLLQQQQQDIVELGKLIVCLACSSMTAILQNNLPKSSEVISSTYSGDVRMLLQHLLNKSAAPKKINDLMPMIGARFYTHIEELRSQNDIAETELKKELENGRLFRLLCKLNAILDRPEHYLDPGWCETTERYIIKLFRNYIFHKVDEVAAPWIDLPHILQCLNKLDTGSLEQIMLTSPHEQSVIICSYKDVKNNFDKCFAEIFMPASL